MCVLRNTALPSWVQTRRPRINTWDGVTASKRLTSWRRLCKQQQVQDDNAFKFPMCRALWECGEQAPDPRKGGGDSGKCSRKPPGSRGISTDQSQGKALGLELDHYTENRSQPRRHMSLLHSLSWSISTDQGMKTERQMGRMESKCYIQDSERLKGQM